MSDERIRSPTDARIVGVLALLLAAIYAVDAWQTLSMGRWHKPGAAIFPIAVGLLLAISAIAVLLERHGSAEDLGRRHFHCRRARIFGRLLSAMAAFAVYFLAMPLHRQHDRLGAVSARDDGDAVG